MIIQHMCQIIYLLSQIAATPFVMAIIIESGYRLLVGQRFSWKRYFGFLLLYLALLLTVAVFLEQTRVY
jgi:hypothetical protein